VANWGGWRFRWGGGPSFFGRGVTAESGPNGDGQDIFSWKSRAPCGTLCIVACLARMMAIDIPHHVTHTPPRSTGRLLQAWLVMLGLSAPLSLAAGNFLQIFKRFGNRFFRIREALAGKREQTVVVALAQRLEARWKVNPALSERAEAAGR